jgi:hypothetical protein
MGIKRWISRAPNSAINFNPFTTKSLKKEILYDINDINLILLNILKLTLILNYSIARCEETIGEGVNTIVQSSSKYCDIFLWQFTNINRLKPKHQIRNIMFNIQSKKEYVEYFETNLTWISCYLWHQQVPVKFVSKYSTSYLYGCFVIMILLKELRISSFNHWPKPNEKN